MLPLLLAVLGGGLDVDWVAPSGCPDGDAVERAVRSRADEAFGTAPVRVRGRVRGRPGAWRLQLQVRTAGDVDERQIEDPDCTALADAAALIVALTMERTPGRAGDPVLRALEPTTPTAAVWPELPPPSPATVADTPPPRRPERTVRAGARVSAGVELGALPGVGADLEVAALLERKRFVAELGARYEPPRKARYPDGSGAGGDLSLWAVGGLGCFAPAAGRVRFPLCLGAEGGAMHGRGVGIVQARRDTLPWGAGRARAGVSVAVQPWLRLVANAGLLVPWTRPRFSTDSRGVLHRAAPVAGRFNLGFAFVTPDRRNRS